MTPIEAVIDRLHSVKKRQIGQYSARCPAHVDKGPSLSVREAVDGAVLLHCFAGCSAQEIVGSLGLELHDLFPPRERSSGAPTRTQRLLTAGQALELLADEAMLIAVAAGNVAHGVVLTTVDTDRVIKAAGRINWLRHEATGEIHA